MSPALTFGDVVPLLSLFLLLSCHYLALVECLSVRLHLRTEAACTGQGLCSVFHSVSALSTLSHLPVVEFATHEACSLQHCQDS